MLLQSNTRIYISFDCRSTAAARLSESMIWLSVKPDFFIAEILTLKFQHLKTLGLRGITP